METKILLEDDLCFSYNQFMIYDSSEEQPGCEWTDTHFNQGFARRSSIANFGTILEFGNAKLHVYAKPPNTLDQYNRVIVIPFVITSGKVNIEGPEEDSDCRSFNLNSGYYKLWCAQSEQDDENENIDIFFEAVEVPMQKSEILIADDELSPPDSLLETSDIAEV
jgi:Competence protein J (ComJ)